MHVGFEIEIAGLHEQHLRRKIRKTIPSKYMLSFHDDGSIRRLNYAIGDVPILPIRIGSIDYLPAGAGRIDNFGPEIVTGVYEKEDILDLATELSSVLYKIPEDPRSSIHVHISGFRDWRHIQRLVKLVYILEAPLFRISALGGRHRGELLYNGSPNDYRYCRPLSAPIHIYGYKSTNLVPLIDMEALLTADTFSRFLSAWGRLDYFWSGNGSLNHYCPHRLHMINLASLMRHRTVEFRLWNGVPRYLRDAVDISIRLFEIAAREDMLLDYEPILLGSKPGDFGPSSLAHILDYSVDHLWGNYWPKGVMQRDLMSHYSNHNEIATNSKPYLCEWISSEEVDMNDDT